ncbi:hypothetical protein SS1G_13720 [Sclerotinia sclerotiorum 1980 UF-70]|uniref:Quinate transporter n=1 Tax=Sclerotinia sclerotiorum (strain ATCC 18683 / 1980 / Ss-1) TaxID=665079 RepID=A7F7Z0_SCLS1|nr:hypothetical protein SS1G_13720 [Sclerotinia sclerotiorum 1980 UF-70]EDN98861.1 hypothetical protein SS1G_13720 [Sclerotinia sclerotiorum 1980 UF-70]
MGILSKVEDRPTPSQVYNWRVYLCSIVAGFAAVMIGYDSAFIGTTIALPSFKQEFNFEALSDPKLNLVSANIVSCYQAGAFFGALLAYIAAYWLGRVRGMAVFSAVFTVGAGMMLGANERRGLGLIYGGRVLAGLGVGGCSSLAPIYISEISPPAIRGQLVCMFELGWQIGGLIGFWINWLMSKGKREKAIKNLCWIRNLTEDDIYIKEEIYAIDQNIEQQMIGGGLGFWQPFKLLTSSQKIQWRFFLGGSLFFWQNASGINAVNYYSPTIFKSIGIIGTNTSLFSTGLFGVVKTVGTFIYLLFLIDQLGRRKLLMIGSIGGALCMYYVAGYIAIAKPADHPTDSLPPSGVSAVFFFYLWTAFYTPTWNPTPWVINAEIFDQSVRTLAQAHAAAHNWLWNFLISRFTPQMFSSMGYGVYLFFASLMIWGAAFVFFLIPETKNVPLEAVDRLFDRNMPARKAHAVVWAESEQEEEALRAGIAMRLEKDRTSTYVENV